MTYEQGVRLATRTIALYLIIQGIVAALGLLQAVPAAIRLAHLISPPPSRYHVYDRGLGTEVLWSGAGLIALSVTRIAAYLFAARWFYVSGTWLQRFFGDSD